MSLNQCINLKQGLADELGAAEGLLFFWAVDFAPSS